MRLLVAQAVGCIPQRASDQGNEALPEGEGRKTGEKHGQGHCQQEEQQDSSDKHLVVLFSSNSTYGV